MTNRELAPEFDLADRMRKALRTAGLTVQEMADYLGVTRTTASNWINGKVPPSKQSKRLWALRTGVSFEWLETGENPHQLVADEGAEVLPRLDSNQQPAGYRPEPWPLATTLAAVA
ncbi:MAG TPA: helix-turn-helix transcriptional regulator [Pseudonocardia sp.]